MKTAELVALCLTLFFPLESSVAACTVFFAFDGKSALGGSNEDWGDPNTQIWFVPATKDNYGIVYFGFGRGEYPKGGVANRKLTIPDGGITKINPEDLYGLPQGGMNEKGLFFDGASTDMVRVATTTGKETYGGQLEDLILRKCATIEEALRLIERYDFRFPQGQWLFADKSGDSFIIEAGEVIIRKKGSYQVMTNFLQSRVEPDEVSCPRHQLVSKTLADEKALSVELARSLLKATSIKST
jgi:penicillin V acylase-like amidase (Ntn superfamily)